jgi:hypothetical protein
VAVVMGVMTTAVASTVAGAEDVMAQVASTVKAQMTEMVVAWPA